VTTWLQRKLQPGAALIMLAPFRFLFVPASRCVTPGATAGAVK
jgi:hypothetical protein